MNNLLAARSHMMAMSLAFHIVFTGDLFGHLSLRLEARIAKRTSGRRFAV